MRSKEFYIHCRNTGCKKEKGMIFVPFGEILINKI